MKRLHRPGLIIIVVVTVIIALGAMAPVTVHAVPTAPSNAPIMAQSGGIGAVVWANSVNVRRAPRLTSSIKGRLVKGETVLLIGRVADGVWVQAVTGFGIGWMDKSWLTYNGTTLDLPVVAVLPPFLTTTNGVDGTNIRFGPDDKYHVVGTLRAGVEADMIAFFDRPRWYEIVTPNGVVGWVFSGAVDITGDTSFLPAANALPTGAATTYNLEVRTAPDLNAPVIGDIRQNQPFAIIGRDWRGNWWQIEGHFGSGWVWAKFITTVGDINAVPVTAGSPTPPHPILN